MSPTVRPPGPVAPAGGLLRLPPPLLSGPGLHRPWPLLPLPRPLPVLAMDRVVLPHEEGNLRQARGDACDQDRARARRWL